MAFINKSKFLAELSKLLAGMTERDRNAALARFSAMYDGEDSEEAVSARIGGPTRAAISVLRGYVPTPEPEGEPGAPAASDGIEAETEEPISLSPRHAANRPESEARPEPSEAEPAPPSGEPDEGKEKIEAPEAAEAPEPEAGPVSPEDFPDIEALLESGEAGDEPGEAGAAETLMPESSVDMLPPVEGNAAPDARAADASPGLVPPEKPAETLSEPEPLEKGGDAAHRKFVTILDEPVSEPEPEPEADYAAPGSAGAVGWRVALYVLFSLVICLPVAALLTALALVILSAGMGISAAGVFVITLGFTGMSVFADVMLLCGAGLVVAALGLPVMFLAVWAFLRGVVGFINLVLRGGKRWCAERGEEDEL